MQKNKSFDCVEMKNSIQAKLQEESSGLSEEQIRNNRQNKLQSSNDAVAKWWRCLVDKKASNA